MRRTNASGTDPAGIVRRLVANRAASVAYFATHLCANISGKDLLHTALVWCIEQNNPNCQRFLAGCPKGMDNLKDSVSKDSLHTDLRPRF